MNNEIEFKFGDYAIIEQKRHGVPNEMFVHKVIGQLRSNSWVDVPVQSPATETLHDEMEDVCWCICCGVDETEVRAYRVKDMQRSSRSPDGREVTALALTLERSREASGCPAGVDLQDWVKQLAAENVAFAAENKMAVDAVTVFSNVTHDITEIICDELGHDRVAEIVSAFNDLGNMTATDRIVAETEARGVEKFAAKLRIPGDDQFFDALAKGVAIAADDFAKQLREGAK